MYKLNFTNLLNSFSKWGNIFTNYTFDFLKRTVLVSRNSSFFFHVYIEGENMSSLSENNLENKTNKHGRETTNNI